MENIAVYVANCMTIVLMFMMIVVCKNKLYVNKKELKLINSLGVLILFSSFIEILIWASDGKIGPIWWFSTHILNIYQFLAFPTIAYLWVIFLLLHLKHPLSLGKSLLLAIPLFIGYLLVFINIFVPFIFKIENEKYIRLGGYFIIFFIAVIYMIISLIFYFIIKIKSKELIFFEAWIFVIPVLIGAIISLIAPFIPNMKAISVIIPFCSIGFSGVIASIQNETIYIDRLTKVYNRSFMDFYLTKKRKKSIMGIMLDINDFKNINDSYGHEVGDEAIINFAQALKKIVSTNGVVIRYAGDEFIILLNTIEKDEASLLISKIEAYLLVQKDELRYPYDIKFSYGLSLYNPNFMSFDAFLNIIDENMYYYKRLYHKETNKD